MSSAPDPEFVEAIAAWALKDAARRSPVEAVERALADYGSPKIGTDEYVSVRYAAVVKSTTARLDVSWPAQQPTIEQDEAADAAARLQAWFEDTSGPMVMDEADFDDVETVLADYGRILGENERMRRELESARIRLDLLALPVSAEGLRTLLAVAEQQPDAILHAHRAHPAYEYATTEGQRKAFDAIDVSPEGDNWERNVDAGRPGEGWERFDYHEESYWRRLRAPVSTQPVRSERSRYAVKESAMPESAARRRPREAREKAAAEREPGAVTPPLGDKRMAEIQRLREAMVLPVGMAVGWAIDELVAEVERLRYREKVLDRRNAESVQDYRDIEDENDRLITELSAANAELERYRGLDAAAKELLARTVELGTSADNAEAKCEDLEDEAVRLRAKVVALDDCLTATAAAKGSNRYVGQGQLVTLLSLDDVREMISEWREAGGGDE